MMAASTSSICVTCSCCRCRNACLVWVSHTPCVFLEKFNTREEFNPSFTCLCFLVDLMVEKNFQET
ncbi:hypothetical protein GLYMA_03G110000v4 [Glycine max]|uniref:Uncharacterized protein n=1 Tax=Glycine max TaxID=3847 RepID=A0A0R0KHE0_SOYBN|nr:hypothetical protein JHK87_006985 [Glycine soja]KAG5054846.1 hypothetical protein JHK85_007356 [Glycine max]KAG5071935.1 hypothetical protein JHK86_007146 [Glycine max]KAH1069453.1 hypothetical protein GYH30_006886 [Glycine max]KRH66492.1 hypothetical protein GLYMA_03G110000v4 [Glycine max]